MNPDVIDWRGVSLKGGKFGRRGLPSFLVARIVEDYRELRSTRAVAAIYGRTPQSIWSILARRNITFRRRLMDPIEWGGRKFTRSGKGATYRATSGDRAPLHHLVWEAHHGTHVPAGHEILFMDGNPANCDPVNLESVPVGEKSRRQFRIPFNSDAARREYKARIARESYWRRRHAILRRQRQSRERNQSMGLTGQGRPRKRRLSTKPSPLEAAWRSFRETL